MPSPVSVKGTAECNALGDNVVFPCPVGKRVRLYFFGYSAGAGVSGVLVNLKLQGTSIDSQYLVAPGQPYARNIQAGQDKNYVDGLDGEDLVVELSAGQLVYVNYELELV